MVHDILLYEPNQERAIRLIFLLRLKDIHCTHVRSVEEARNCLSALRLNVISFDMFLLGSLVGIKEEDQLLIDLSELTCIPVVYAPLTTKSIPEALPNLIIICEPEGLLECVKHQFDVEGSWQQTGSVQ